jgi:hypothetical protein
LKNFLSDNDRLDISVRMTFAQQLGATLPAFALIVPIGESKDVLYVEQFGETAAD